MQERQQEQLIRRTIEGVVLVALHPRACISVIIQVRTCLNSFASYGLQHGDFW